MSPRALLEASGYLLPRNRLRRQQQQQQGTTQTPATDTPGSGANAVGAATPAAIPLEAVDPVARAADVRVAVVIAMPNPHRSAYVAPAVDAETHRDPSPLSIGLSLGLGKGKARSLEGWSEDGHEEEGVPDVVFGVTHVPVVQGDGAGEEETEAKQDS